MTYEYVCTACQHEWEASQPISEAPLKECPACHQLAAKRQISRGGGFVLKGGGWYSDLYSSSRPAADASKDGGGESAAPAKTETKAESAGDAKAAPVKAADPTPSA
jgi:putative FmdB family regulatory protein